MKRILTSLAFILTSIATEAVADSETSVSNAFGLCRVFDGTGLLSEPCSVSGWNSSVDVKMDTNGSEARKICSGIVDMMRTQGIRFDSGWTIRIYSPFSGDSTIAQCNL